MKNQSKRLSEAILKFQKRMQKIVDDDKTGITSISISSPTLDKDVVIAEKENEKPKQEKTQ